MKKHLGWMLVWILGSFPLWGQDLRENQRWIEQIDGGFVFPLSSAASAGYDHGYGGDILVGYRFDRDFSLSGDIGYYDCDQRMAGADQGEWIYVPILAMARYNFGAGPVRPFLLMGAGVAVNSYALTQGINAKVSKRETDLMLAPGAGVLFLVGSGTALYLQARLDLNFSTPEGPWTDNPNLFLPVKGGLSFFVL